MPTIGDLFDKLVRPYERTSQGEKSITSAKNLARMVLENQSKLTDQDIKRVLSYCQWFISVSDGKYTPRYRSRDVIRLAKECSNETKARFNDLIIHDHVFTRKYITEKIICQRQNAGEYLNMVIGCIVTKSEHDDRLARNGTGWYRYIKAGIEVYDMAETPPKLLGRSELTQMQRVLEQVG